MTEAALQAAILETAKLLGWRCAHFRAAMTSKGWRTPVAADGAGFPDLVLCRGDRLVFAELKSKRGVLSQAQRQWLAALDLTGAEVVVWTPGHWSAGVVEACLRAERRVAA